MSSASSASSSLTPPSINLQLQRSESGPYQIESSYGTETIGRPSGLRPLLMYRDNSTQSDVVIPDVPDSLWNKLSNITVNVQNSNRAMTYIRGVPRDIIVNVNMNVDGFNMDSHITHHFATGSSGYTGGIYHYTVEEKAYDMNTYSSRQRQIAILLHQYNDYFYIIPEPNTFYNFLNNSVYPNKAERAHLILFTFFVYKKLLNTILTIARNIGQTPSLNLPSEGQFDIFKPDNINDRTIQQLIVNKLDPLISGGNINIDMNDFNQFKIWVSNLQKGIIGHHITTDGKLFDTYIIKNKHGVIIFLHSQKTIEYYKELETSQIKEKEIITKIEQLIERSKSNLSDVEKIGLSSDIYKLCKEITTIKSIFKYIDNNIFFKLYELFDIMISSNKFNPVARRNTKGLFRYKKDMDTNKIIANPISKDLPTLVDVVKDNKLLKYIYNKLDEPNISKRKYLKYKMKYLKLKKLMETIN
jgi:hypothetical protein